MKILILALIMLTIIAHQMTADNMIKTPIFYDSQLSLKRITLRGVSNEDEIHVCFEVSCYGTIPLPSGARSYKIQSYIIVQELTPASTRPQISVPLYDASSIVNRFETINIDITMKLWAPPLPRRMHEGKITVKCSGNGKRAIVMSEETMDNIHVQAERNPQIIDRDSGELSLWIYQNRNYVHHGPRAVYCESPLTSSLEKQENLWNQWVSSHIYDNPPEVTQDLRPSLRDITSKFDAPNDDAPQ